MTPKDMLTILESKDFSAIRVLTHNGGGYEIRNPGMAYLSGTNLVILPAVTRHEGDGLPVIVPLRSISAIEPIEARAA